MSDWWNALAEDVVEDLKNTGLDFWDRLSADQIPVVRQAARDLTRYVMLSVQEPERRSEHMRTIRHIRGILESEAALTALRARRYIRDAILRTIRKSIEVGISLL